MLADESYPKSLSHLFNLILILASDAHLGCLSDRIPAVGNLFFYARPAVVGQASCAAGIPRPVGIVEGNAIYPEPQVSLYRLELGAPGLHRLRASRERVLP